MAANCRGHAKAGKQLVARSSGVSERSVLQNSRNRKMKTSFNISNLRAQTLGFEFQTEETATNTKMQITQDLAVGFSRELDQRICRKILHIPNNLQKKSQDFLETDLLVQGGTLCVPVDTKMADAVSRDLTGGF